MERVTQRELARRLGISQASVSRALAGHAKHSPALRKNVQKEARKAGYRPDPVLASLNAYRRTRRPISRGGSLVWIGASRPNEHPYETLLFKAAQNRAEQLGYGLDYLWRFDPDLTMARIIKICRARDVAGLFLGPQPEPHARLDLDVSSFACVSLGRSVDQPAVDFVSVDHFQTMELSFAKLAEAGFRRIGFSLTMSYNERVSSLWSGAFMAQQLRHPHLPSVPPLLDDHQEKGTFKKWFHKWRPEVIITMGWQFGCLPAMDLLDIRHPRDVHVALLVVPEYKSPFSQFAGIREPVDELARFAVNILTGHIRNNERGIPKERHGHLLPGIWKGRSEIFR